MAHIIEVNDAEQLGAYRMAWNALLGETPRASFFHTFDWFESYWRHFGEGHKLRVMVVEAAGRPIGIMPLVVRNERRHFGNVRVLTYPLEGWGVWYSPLGGAQAATLTMVMRRLATTPRDWDMIDLPWTDHEGADRKRTARAMIAAGLPCSIQPDETSSIIETRGSWEDYLATRSQKVRHDIRRKLRRVEELGEVEHIRHRPAPLREGDGDPAWSLYDECESVASESWQSGVDGGNTLSDERYRPFLREVHELAARQGMVDMNLLRINGRAVAFSYNYFYRGQVYGLRMGFRGEYSHAGVGAALLLMTMRDGFARGDECLELGAGDQEYKRRYRTRVERSWRLTHTPIISWRSQAVRLSRWVKSRSGNTLPAAPSETKSPRRSAAAG